MIIMFGTIVSFLEIIKGLKNMQPTIILYLFLIILITYSSMKIKNIYSDEK